MKKRDVAIMLGMFEKVFGKRDDKEPEITIDLWYRFLCDEPADLAQTAADKYIAINKYFPKPAEILELIEKEKHKIWASTVSVDLFGDKPKKIPDEYGFTGSHSVLLGMQEI